MSAQKKCKQIIAADHSVRCITLSESEIRGGKLEENVVCFFSEYISTSSYENRVSKHFVIFLNFACLIAFLLCCLLMSFVFACFVVRDLCRSGCGENYYLAPPLYFFLSLPTILSLIRVTVIWNQCAPKAGFGAVPLIMSSLLLDTGHLEKSFPESIM